MKIEWANKKTWTWSTILFFTCFALVVYWPLSSWLFAVKNDNITYFLPWRFHVSEALRSGHLPLWSPYLYLGMPLHGDMQSGAWNPLVWLLSMPGRYNVTTLHTETLIYLVLSGLGMHRLLAAMRLTGLYGLMAGAAYLASGFLTDVAGSNLAFLASAAFLPFVFAYAIELQRAPTLPASLRLAMALTLLLLCGYPSFFICAAYVVTAGLLFSLIHRLRSRSAVVPLLRGYGWMILVFLLLCAPALLSFWQILPHYQRGSGVSLEIAQTNPFEFKYSWSYLLPGFTAAQNGATDLISRNGYFNFLLFFGMFASPWLKRDRWTAFLIAGLLFFYLFSLGDQTPVRELAYDVLPLMDSFRHPSNARLFVIIAGLLLGCRGIQAWHGMGKRLHIGVPILMLIVLSWPFVARWDELDFSAFTNAFSSGFGRTSLKAFFQQVGYLNWGFVNMLVQIAFIGLSLRYAIRKQVKALAWLLIINSALIAQFTIPYTLVSQEKPAAINHLLQAYPKGFPKPDPNTTIGAMSADSMEHFSSLGFSSFYTKALPFIRQTYSPTYLRAYDRIYEHPMIVEQVRSKSYAFANEEACRWELIDFNNNEWTFALEAIKPTRFHLRQIHLPYWKAFVNGRPTAVLTSEDSFVSAEVPAGKHRLRFRYAPPMVLPLFLLSLLGWIAGIIFLIKKRRHA